MYCIERGGSNQFKCLVEGQPFTDVVSQALQVAQSGVSLVAMIDVLLDAQLLEEQHTADAQENLLLEAVLPVTAIKSMGDGLVELGVHLVVGVKKIELHTADVDAPNVCMHLIVHIWNVDDHRRAVLVHLLLNWQRTEVLCFVVGNLLSVHCQALCEIAIAIEEADGTHIDVGVGCFLHIVTGQHTEAAAVYLQGRVDAVLHAEVGNGGTLMVRLHIHILAEV